MHACRNILTTIKTSGHASLEKYTSHFIERIVCERELETEQNCNILTSPAPPDIAVCLSRSPGLLNRWPGGPALCCVLLSLQHHFSKSLISKLGYIIIQRSLNLFPLMANRICHFRRLWNGMFWSSSSGNNCHAVHRSLISGASLCDGTMAFLPYPILSAKLYFTYEEKIKIHNDLLLRNNIWPSG